MFVVWRYFRQSFLWRIFRVFSLMTFLIALAFLLIVYSQERANYRIRSDEKARVLSRILLDAIRMPLFAGDVPSLERRAQEMIDSFGVARVVVSNARQQVLVTRQAAEQLAGTATATIAVDVESASHGPSVDVALSGGEERKGGVIGRVELTIDTSDLRRSMVAALWKICAVVVLFWLLVLALSYPVLRRVTRSIAALTEGLNVMVGGDFSLRIDAQGEDEAARAARTVNMLAATLQEREAENRRLNAELVESMRLEVREEKRRIMAKLIQTNRMTSLGLLISSLAHNINTPNAAVKLAGQHVLQAWRELVPLLELVEQEEGDCLVGGLLLSEQKHEVAQALEAICRNSERVEQVVKDLRAYGVGERSGFAPDMDVNRAVEGALAMVRSHVVRHDIAIAAHLAPHLSPVCGNQNQIEQVVVNLLMNAIQALPDGNGQISVTSVALPDSGEVLVVVEDTGCGIPDEIRLRLFEPFFSTRIEQGGSGLGLYISSFIIDEHGGRLQIDNAPQGGTRAEIYLPLAESEGYSFSSGQQTS